ncbi:DNA (cytosine-5)-methyltransferase 1 [Sphingobacterium allocomposti]|uniref:DNA (cytosine-5-)-methyltransferase n=1 Tax=Sphingobacterium allocomposti TaxID=415956 RepID=A0A5S5D212_9SPHI|nr:DNA cytosine methyltransferase [Sphingobacterium composti Yoo et al. 2007 non Ten et al. 2007]TYP89444.1 DNA (cytosine-5)-methyltransferase 1 [Sphingobacterium composti Yoo et al. 2007 non Ten et al. 2007]
MINAFILQHKPFTPQIVDNPQAIRYIVVDLFCGAGGTTTGFAQAKDKDGNPIALIAACVNHDHKAIRSHWENHPEVYHFEEDIRTLELSPLVDIVTQYRKLYPWAKVVLWASLECTNFSKAKGGQARDADSRTLADHLDRYIKAIDPDYVQIENVVEFMSWGPLNENGKPVSMKSGQDWLRWREHINSFGYRDEWRELNSADFGAYTSRNRLFGCFAKHGLPIVWPEPTHSKNGGKKDTLFGDGLKKWNAVRDLLDFEDEGISIFGREKPLVENSLKRIYAGLVKEVAGGKESFLVKYNSMNQRGKVAAQSIDDPSPVISCQGRLALAQTSYIVKHYSGSTNDKISSIDSPAPTITTIPHESLVSVKPFVLTSNFKGISRSINEPCPTLLASRKHHYFVNPAFLVNYNHSSKTNDLNNPCPTILTRDKLALATPCFLAKYYGNGENVQSVNEPAGTLTTKDRFTLIQTNWLDKQYSGERNHQSVNQPAGSILANDKHCLMTAKGFIYNPSHGGHTMHIEQPCPTIIARQDKAPLYFIQYVIDPNVRIEIYEGDSETMIKIKEFMALYGISDIKMRMLKVSELKVIQGFPADYKLYGNQSDQKKFIGNSVVPHVVQAWAEAQGEKLLQMVA